MAIYVGDKRYASYIGDKRRRYMGGSSSLPYDAEVEYLQTTGTQYIDTGVSFNQDTDFYAELAIAQEIESKNTTFFEVWSTGQDVNNSYGLMNLPVNNTFQFRRMGRTWISGFLMQADTIYTFHTEANKLYINDVLKATASVSTFQQTYNTLLFARFDGPRAYQGSRAITPFNGIRCYDFKIYQQGEIIRDFAPVRKGTTGYLYDKVSQQIFGNGGTGDFILGPDKT